MPLDADEIMELPFVCAPESHARRTTLDRSLRERGVARRRIGLAVRQAGAIKDALAFGAGYAFMLSCAVETDLASGRLARVPTALEPMGVGCGVWVRRGRPITQIQASAIAAMRASAAQRSA